MSEDKIDCGVKFDPEFYLITFMSASHCIETEKRAREAFKVHIIPTPREVSASCGMALKFSDNEITEIGAFFQELDVPSQFYALGLRGQDGKRPIEKLGEKS